MHTFGDIGSGVPAFLAKLWRLVEDTETNALIYWSQDGRSFIIQNQAQFARDLLPLNYKHNNMASFIRQLNMYGFHKITSIDNGGLKFDRDRDEMEFSHPYFKRGHPKLLENIKRKIATTKEEKVGNIKPESVNKVLNDVKAMRGKQETLDSRFNVMKQENEALWREIASLRQKHIKQQQIVNKLIQFLVTIVQPSRNMSGVKRHFQLMINDAPHSSKMRKVSESESGPVIHELTEGLLDEVADNNDDDDDDLLSTNSPHMGEAFDMEVNSPNRPQSNASISNQFYEHSNQSADIDDGLQHEQNSPLPIYNIKEISDNIDNTNPSDLTQIIDENVLNTPMVKQELARNLQRQQQQQDKLLSDNRQQRYRRKRPATVTYIAPSTQDSKNTETKKENDLDSFIFLDDNAAALGNNTVDSTLSMPTIDNKNEPMPSTSTSSKVIASSCDNEFARNDTNGGNPQQQDNNLFNEGNFLSTEMPTNIFDSSPFNPNDLLRMDESSKTAPEETTNDDTNKALAVTKYNSPKSTNELIRHDVTTHIENVQDDLDNLKDLLRSEGYSFDANALMGLFNDSDALNPYSGMHGLPNDMHGQDKKGSELMTYQPYYSDFSDILEMNSKTSEYDDKSNDFPELSVLNTPHTERE